MQKTATAVIGLTAILSAAFLSMPAHANVSLRNGNFYIGYTDIVYPGGFEPKIERVYNSKTMFMGIFGHGWGNEYEVYLTVSADGSVIVHEYGGGADNRFSPAAFNAKERDQAVEMIARAAIQTGAIGTGPREITRYKNELKNNAEYRNSEWENFRRQGRLKARELKVGTQLHSNKFSYQYVTRVKDGYVRNFDNGRVEKFNDQGRLVRISDKNGNSIALSYGNDGHIRKLVDNFNRQMTFQFNSQGFLERISGENSKRADFKYNGAGDLVYSRDVDGNVYTYEYDRDHNMTQIGYADKTTMTMNYYGRDKNQNIHSIKDRDGMLTDYSYWTDSSDRNHFSVDVKVTASDAKTVSSSKYEYFMKTKADGEEWQYKLISSVDGDRTETTYNECCGLPILIKHDGEETSFEYDKKGHVTKKITPTEITELNYDPGVSKVNKVVRYSKLNKKQSTWSTFQYDGKGNLIFAKNSEGKGVRLFYDNVGRIASLIDQNRRRINFRYNENSKPIEITDPSLGTINVSYTNSGEIKKVESTAGRRIALQVTSAFENLLQIIRPAGVNLSF